MLFYFFLLQAGYAQTPTDGLVAYWSFDEEIGTTALDSSGNDNTGTLINGPSWVTGRVGNALSFDGINDYVEINDNNNLDLTVGEFTLSAWIYPESYGAALSSRIIDHGGGSPGEGGWSLLVSNESGEQRLRIYIKNGNSFSGTYSDINTIALNTWQHVAVTFQSGMVTMYINGQIKGQASGLPTPTDTNAPVRIGMRATDVFRTFTGVIDEVYIYNRALTPQEIMDLNNQPPPLSDMDPPVITDGQPVGELPLETTSATLSVTTDETATCKYTIFPDIPYSQIQDTFSNTGGTTHTNPISGLEYIQSRTYYVKCRDQSGNSNPVDYTVSFYFNRTVYSVSPSGSDTNPGTEVLPFKTIQHAIDSASGNNSYETIIKVAQGTYYENISIVCCSSRNNWRILGGWDSDFIDRDENPSTTVIDGGGKQRVIKINVPALDLTIEGLMIRNGFDSVSGGGIAVFPFYHGTITLNLVNNIIAHNRAGSAGGGVYVFSSKESASTTLNLSSNVIVNNHADDSCGGVCVVSEDSANTIVNLEDNALIDNSAGCFGGGIYFWSYNGAKITSTFTNNLINNNSAAYLGAGVYAYSESGASLSIEFANNRITGNAASYLGGGVYLHSVSDSTLNTSYFTKNKITGNSAGYDGGGIYFWGATTSTFANNIVAGNSASRGAGVFATEGATLTFTNDTITNNLGDGIAGDLDTTVDIRNTIIWGNDSTDINKSGNSIINVSHSDIGSGTFNDDGTSFNIDPKFLDNYHLSSSSPLINKGDNVAASDIDEDFEGDPRIMYDKVDIGADEHIFRIIKPDILPTMIIDGNLSEYAGGDSIRLNPSTGGNTVTVRAVWDDEALYLSYEVTDTQLNASVTTRDGYVKNEDSVGWLIDTLNDGGGSEDPNAPYMLDDDYQGVVNILNTKYDLRGTTSGVPTSSWNGSWQSAVQFNGTINDNLDIDTGYTVEMKIPWTDLFSTAFSGDNTVKIGFLLNDKDDSSCNVDPTGTYIDAENYTDTQNEAANFSEQTSQGGYLNTSYLRTLLPVWQNIFTTQTLPGSPHGPDSPVENGVKWTSDINGYVTGVRFYKHSSNTGTHKGRLWQGTTLLANATFTNETSSGWQTVYFDSPVSVIAGTTYIVSYHSVSGYYYQSNSYFGAVDNPPLHISATAGQNGVFRYGLASTFECSQMPCTPAAQPTSTANANFWVDVIFVQTSPSCSDISGREYKKYEVDFPADAYTVWLRGYGVAGADTVLVGVDGSCIGTYQFNARNQWSWSNTAIAGTNSTGTLSAASHHIDIWTRQANVLIDGIYLTTRSEIPTDIYHGIEIDPSYCSTTSHAMWPEGGGTAFENASNWQEVQITISKPYYCDDDHDGYIDAFSDGICYGSDCAPAGCQTIPDTDCNDNDFYEHPNQTWYKDYDNDDYADGTADPISCTRPQGYKTDLELTATSGDCDDTNEFAYPWASEIWYDGVDQDCDGCNDYDQDKDGFVNETWNDKADNCSVDTDGCCSPDTNDCNDTDPVLNPDTQWYPDSDGDGYGNPTYAFVQCTQPSGPPDYVLGKNLDCDDNNANIYPRGPELRIIDAPTSYYWMYELQTAYNDALDGETIQSKVGSYTGDFTAGENKSVIIEGGYDCSYSVISGITTVHGDIFITDGSVTAEHLKLDRDQYGY